MPRPGQHARDVARKLRWDLLRANKKLFVYLAGVLFLAGSLVALANFFLGSTLAAFLAGALAIGIAWLAWEIVEGESGARTWASGAMGEDQTAATLKKIPNHELVHGLKFHGFDVDHVVVGPSGVTAVETKWTSRDLDLSLGANERRIVKDLSDARRGADQISKFLRLAHKVDVVVHPLLIIWGSGVRDVEGGQVELEEITIVVGRQAKRWREKLFSSDWLAPPQQKAALRALRFQEGRQV